jgi:superfamily II DNA or RNA helicase
MLEGVGDDALARSLSTARVEMKPHQVDAALFALKSPLTRGAILADEVGLGKTIEAGLVIAQRWAERRRRILLIVPASLRKQWSQELQSKFSLATTILEAKTYRDLQKASHRRPFESDNIIISSYEFAARKAEDLAGISWDLVVFDEAHRLRNVYKQNGSRRAKELKRALQERFKVLLTATPLQNSLMELYGLVSVVDEHIFGDEFAFKTSYMGRTAGNAGLLMLRDRLKPVCRRTLRKQALEAGHISYTRRNAITARFEPYDREHELYQAVSAFLQREDTILFGEKANALVTLIYRKILGSSTVALVETLNSSIESLKRKRPISPATLIDIDTAEEIAEELDGDENDAEGEPIDPAKLEAEIAELTRFRDLAREIGPQNAKGEKLLNVLPEALDQIVARGGQRKAVIFTESVRTQRYLRDLLSAQGFEGQIVLLNGSNNDPESKAIYRDWLARHKGTEAISGSKTADMKAAIVEAFRDSKSIMIATESGAEGINLQFCSLVVNFDLPWNPQRVEQRIGRCHRYGQKIDVTVVNFLNLKNRAEERVFELLDQKFRLFDGVFGASDEVLGAIETGVDFERRILEIVQKCRSDDEINAAFDALQAELAASIDADMMAARQKLLDNMDTAVVRLLKQREGEISHVLSDFDERLLTLVRAELPEARFHNGHPRRFDYVGETYTTEWPLADEMGWRFFRLADDNLATQLVERARGRGLNGATLRFRYNHKAHGVLADLEAYIGRHGWLQLSLVTVQTAGKDMQYVVLAGLTDDGEALPAETLDRLFLIPATSAAVSDPLPERLEAVHKLRLGEVIAQAERQTAEWYEAEEEKLARYADDLEKGLDAEIKEIEEEIAELTKRSRDPALPLAEKVALKREAQRKEDRREELVRQRYDRKKQIRDQVNAMLDEVLANLRLEPVVKPLFTIRWELSR